MRQRFFQWIAGDNKGQLSTLQYIKEVDGALYYQFTDGECCAEEYISPMTDDITKLAGKYMVEIDSLTNPWEFYTVEAKKFKDYQTGEEVEVPSIHDITKGEGATTNLSSSDIGQERIRVPKRRQNIMPLPSAKDYPAPAVKVAQPKPVQQPVVQEQPVQYVPTVQMQDQPVITEGPAQSVSYDGGSLYTPTFTPAAPVEVDPVKIFVDNCKKHETEVEMSITVNLPSRDLFRIANSEFEDGGSKFVEYVIQELDINRIIDSLRDALLNTYQDNVEENAKINTEND